MSDILDNLPSASAVCNLRSISTDKEAAANGVWTMVHSEGDYKMEFKVGSTTASKSYQRALAEYGEKMQGKHGGRLKASQIDIDAFNRKRAEWASEFLVKGWRTFIPTLDENGATIQTPSADGVSLQIKGDYKPVISDGKEWLRFNRGAAEAVLKSNPEILDAVMRFAEDSSNFYAVNVEEAADKSSLAA